jgi:hypothetical protein
VLDFTLSVADVTGTNDRRPAKISTTGVKTEDRDEENGNDKSRGAVRR